MAVKIGYKRIRELIGKDILIKIDRPIGTWHPKGGFVYPINSGHVEGIMAPDGEEVDAYLLGVFEPVPEFRGRCIAIIHRTNDDDDKLVVAPAGKGYSDDQIRALTEFQERYFKSEIIRTKPQR
jgi:inorganic pyrophosphatase